MKILVDVNLSPAWIPILQTAGHEARHWCELGSACAADVEIMNWAAQRGYIVLTHDLDFGALLHSTRSSGPSVVQLRAEDVRPGTAAAAVLSALADGAEELERGALMTITPRRRRISLLPLRRAT